MLELGAKVLGNTASAVLQVRDQLNRDTIDSAIDLLNAASRIEFLRQRSLNGDVRRDRCGG